MRNSTFLFLVMTVFCVAGAWADDWPQWLGPQRDSVWRETGIVKTFPAEGLPVKWRTPVALGYAGPAVAGDKVFVLDYVMRAGKIANNPSQRDRLEGSERVLCLDAATGKEQWKHEYECPYLVSYASGPRCTPTVDGNRVYTLGAEGNLLCLDTEDGRVLWQKDFKQEYGAETPLWGVAAHPLVDADRLYCLVGGPGSVAVAFDKRTGRELWRALTASQQGYCPPTMIEHAGTRQLLIWHAESVNSLDPATGKLFWSIPLKPSYGMSIIAPRQLGDYLYASAYNGAAALMKLDRAPPEARVVWRGDVKSAVYCAIGTPYLEDGMIYGPDVQSGSLVGARMEDGRRLWQTTQPTNGASRPARYGNAFLVKHEDRFFLFNEQGDLILARLSPQGYDELGRFHVLEPTNNTFGRRVVWSHPAFAQKCVFARNDAELVCVNLADSD